MNNGDGFSTFGGGGLADADGLTPAMQDYLEMISRLSLSGEPVRVGILAGHLNVKPSSASKMSSVLAEIGYIKFEKYGYITPTEKGKKTGRYLLYRHAVVNRFLCMVNGTSDELSQAEKIEHFLDSKTVSNLEKLIDRMKG